MNSQNPVYVRFSLQEALFSKERLVSFEIDILKLLRIVKKYQLYKKEEILIRTKILQNIQEVKKNMNFLEKQLPKTREIKDGKIDSEREVLMKVEDKKDQTTLDLERQLEEIQARIKAFG
jgi:hypothetical protein